MNSGTALGIWLTEFWNRSLKNVWRSTARRRGPGPVLDADLVAPNGRLDPRPRRVDYVLAEPGIDLDGTLVGGRRRPAAGSVYSSTDRSASPKRETGVFADGWTGLGRRARTTASRRRAGSAATRSSRLLASRRAAAPDKPAGVRDHGRDARRGRATSSRTSAT